MFVWNSSTIIQNLESYNNFLFESMNLIKSILQNSTATTKFVYRAKQISVEFWKVTVQDEMACQTCHGLFFTSI